MQVSVNSITPPPPSYPRNVEAVAKVTLSFTSEHFITIDDVRVIRNAKGELWLGTPRQRNPQGLFVPFLEMSKKMYRELEDAVIPVYEKWATDSAQTQSDPSTVQTGGTL